MRNLGLYAFVLLLLLTTGTGQRVRLVGGVKPREGRVEVYHDGTWGTMCPNSRFNDTSARVVCYMLGYGYTGQAIDDRYGGGSGQIWLEVVRCNGSEKSIEDCQHRGWGNHRCRHYDDVSVSCTSVRLVDGSSSREGRLEVYHNGTWGTACRNNFTQAAARVVCYMHGYEDVGQYIGNRYGAGSPSRQIVAEGLRLTLQFDQPIWLDNVECSGTETNIEDCRHRGWGRHSCEHDEDVSVSCFSEVRLVGDSNSKGRLEVYHNGTWGTVCDDGFTDAAARVVCYSLGYGRTGRVIGNVYGGGSGRIWLDDVRCNGWESHITVCRHNGWGRHNCQHSDDVSVSCIADSAEAVALVGGGNPRVGRLQMFHANQWGTVCDHGFTDAAARVVCYSLGFGYVGRKVDINRYGVGDGLIWFKNVKCTGTEEHLDDCSHGDWIAHNCTHREDVAVSCTDDTPAVNETDSTTSATPVRLVGRPRSRGRLEVFHDGDWGTVCDDYFTDTAAHVVCQMLGFESGSKIDNYKYRTDRRPIWLDDVRCSGRERDIAECSHNGWAVHNCQHRQDVSVSCTRSEIEVRLNGGRDPREGRLEVFYDGVWAEVCHQFNYATALVVCNMLGFGYIGRPTSVATTYYQYGPGHYRDNDWLRLVWCTGTEETIADCSRKGWPTSDCSRDHKQTVSCVSDYAVALVGGGSPREGRLELYYNGIWGTVCSSGFTDAAARVVCYSLGFGYVGRKMNTDLYGIGNGMIWWHGVQCDGTERHIGECLWSFYNCTHDEDVAVSCVGDSSAPSDALSSSPSPAVRSTTSMSSPASSTMVMSSPSSTTSTSSSTSTVGSTAVTSPRTSSTTSSSSSSSTSKSTTSTTSAASTTTSKSSPSSTASSTTSTRSDDNRDAPVTPHPWLIIVGGLMMIFCIVVIFTVVIIACKFFGIEKQLRRRPPEMRREGAMIPMTANSTHRHDGGVAVRYGDLAANNNAYSNFQQPSAPVASAVGGVGTGCISYEPFARYEDPLNDQGRFSRVQPPYETFKGMLNQPTF